MRKKGTAIQQLVGSSNMDITLQDIVDGIEDGLLVIDIEYRIRFVNSVVRSNSPRRGALVGRRCYQALYGRDRPCSAPLWNCPLSAVLHSGSMATITHPVRVLGVEKYLKITAYPLRDRYGSTKAIVELRRDVTAERDLETQILRRHHQLKVLNHIADMVSGLRDLDDVLGIALDDVLELINGTIGGILLLNEEDETLYYHIQRGLSAKFTREMRIHLGEGIAGRVAQTGEPMLLEDISKDQRTARLDLITTEGLKGFVSIPLKARNKVIGVMNVASHVPGQFGADDVSLLNSIGDYLGTAIEQAKLCEQLRNTGERCQALLRHALTAQEEERKRVARELHDETSQALTSLTLSLEALLSMTSMTKEKGITGNEFVERLKTTHAYTVRAGNEVVRLMKELRPTLLDELGMSAAIYRYAKDTLQTQGINVSAESKGTDKRFPPETEITLFRIAQGAIGNILEHSGAKNVSIKVECNANECALRITDDGKGFDVSKITRVDSSGRGAGFFTMKERAGLAGGTCRIESQPGRGTKITAKVPLMEDATSEKDEDTNSR